MTKTCQRAGFLWNELNEKADGQDPAPGDVAGIQGDSRSLGEATESMDFLQSDLRDITIGSTTDSESATKTMELVTEAAGDVNSLQQFMAGMSSIMSSWASTLASYQSSTAELHSLYVAEKANRDAKQREVDSIEDEMRSPSGGVDPDARNIMLSFRILGATQERDRLNRLLETYKNNCKEWNDNSLRTANEVTSSIGTLAGFEPTTMAVAPPPPPPAEPNGVWKWIGEHAGDISLVAGLLAIPALFIPVAGPAIAAGLKIVSFGFGVAGTIYNFQRDSEAVERGEMTEAGKWGNLAIGIVGSLMGFASAGRAVTKIPAVAKKVGPVVEKAFKNLHWPSKVAEWLVKKMPGGEKVVAWTKEIFSWGIGKITKETMKLGGDKGTAVTPPPAVSQQPIQDVKHVPLPGTSQMPKVETPSCPTTPAQPEPCK